MLDSAETILLHGAEIDRTEFTVDEFEPLAGRVDDAVSGLAVRKPFWLCACAHPSRYGKPRR